MCPSILLYICPRSATPHTYISSALILAYLCSPPRAYLRYVSSYHNICVLELPHVSYVLVRGHTDTFTAAYADTFIAAFSSTRTYIWWYQDMYTTYLVLPPHTTIYTHSKSALAIARHFEGHPKIQVLYPGLPAFAGHAVAQAQMPGGFGGVS
jgi:hypothetical protein